MTATGQPRILVVVAKMGHVSQREIRGVRDYARRAGWSVDIVEGRHFGSRPASPAGSTSGVPTA